MQRTIETPHTKIMEHYTKADAAGKKTLHNLFGDDILGNIMDRVKTFDDACEVLGIAPSMVSVKLGGAIPQLSQDTDSIAAYFMLIIIARALNEGWTPDWSNSSEYKYYPFFNFTAGVGFSNADCDDWSSNSTVGSRLCFKSRELALYAGKQFETIYNQFFVIK